ncbi:hypothetical protein FRC20_000491 [Serendipita sp. 405]|nr:hypothetical protein FRC20_000491 [Serendipita sp. 405]
MSTSASFWARYQSPLKIYEGLTLAPLPTGTNADQKSLNNGDINTQNQLSDAYQQHPEPIRSKDKGNSFDFHIYHLPSNADEKKYAQELHERIRREFPEMRIYRFWDRPVGPHPIPMFEINTFTPSETGALFGFLTIWRGPLSVLIHPNTDDEFKDHTELCSWMGRPVPLDTSFLKHGPH